MWWGESPGELGGAVGNRRVEAVVAPWESEPGGWFDGRWKAAWCAGPEGPMWEVKMEEDALVSPE